MEIFELRYFLGVAQTQNIHQAALKLRVSPAALSKAISRLEAELNVKLFVREGRNIKINDHGRLLERKASEIVHLEESTKIAVGGHDGVIHVVIAGPEILLTKFALPVSQAIKKKYPNSTYEFHTVDDGETLAQVQRGEAHIGIVTAAVPDDLEGQVLGEVEFKTYVGAGHHLHERALRKRAIPVAEVLVHDFVSPTVPILGSVGAKQSLDGWRDDKFPRRVTYAASSLKLLEELVVSGTAIGYLPDHFAEKLAVFPLKITDCPYRCQQKISLVIRSEREIGWLNQVF